MFTSLAFYPSPISYVKEVSLKDIMVAIFAGLQTPSTHFLWHPKNKK